MKNITKTIIYNALTVPLVLGVVLAILNSQELLDFLALLPEATQRIYIAGFALLAKAIDSILNIVFEVNRKKA